MIHPTGNANLPQQLPPYYMVPHCHTQVQLLQAVHIYHIFTVAYEGKFSGMR